MRWELWEAVPETNDPNTMILSTLENTNFVTFPNSQLSCFIRSRQSVLSVLGLIFGRALDKNDIRQNEKDKTCVVIKCLH